ncbi:tyrosine-type recombinase/integrase [Geomonas edaphica]|uniref:tyrosine-type recombinase/integrase n=1 Tax=Geomonas edaphica TaxID=2570226 RepID=UPI0010A843C3|nr:tyrosine-type recombinase/integrase [Geomonas edaphica]
MAANAGIPRLKNVSLLHTKTRSGDNNWMLIHEDGWRDPYFDYYAKYLIDTKKSKFNTREQYCRCVGGFIDYIVEAGKWYREGGCGILEAHVSEITGVTCAADLAGPALAELIRIYPKVLAGGARSGDPVVIELSNRLGRRVYSRQSQQIHIAAINHYLALSEGFNMRAHQSGLSEINGFPLLSENNLFPHIGTVTELSRFESIAMSSRTMLGGVIAGGVRLKRLAALKPEIVNECSDNYDYDSAFPLESAPRLINHGFNTYRDRALYCLLMASGIRISEALTLTWHDMDCKKRKIYIRDPRSKDLINVYYNFFTLEERNALPWKGRTHPVTLLIEPFASEFWRLFELYVMNEMLLTSAHPFVFQVLKGDSISAPLILSDQSNIRKSFTSACIKAGIDCCYGPHSLRHMYGVYCLNYWPNDDGTYGLSPEKVQFLMGHSDRNSTMHYAKPDTQILAAEQKINAAIMSGFAVEDRANVRVKILSQMLESAMAEVRTIQGMK